MKLGLQAKLRQTIAPQLIQSLHLLQVPILKLEQLLRVELSTNPLLEEAEALEEEPETDTATPETESADGPNDPELNKIDWDNYLDEDAKATDYAIAAHREKDQDEPLQTPVSEKTLYEHLADQLSLHRVTEEERQIGLFIIGNIDQSGFLTISVEEIAETLQVPVAAVEKVLKVIQGFDPVGVGARDLREALLIQMRERGLEDTLPWQIVAEQLTDLDRKSNSQLARLLGVELERVEEAMAVIRTLSPRPATGRFVTAAQPVVPDLTVERIGEEFVVYHNDRNIPRLRINPAYREMLRRNSSSAAETKSYVREKLEQARWLLNAINQRRNTMIKVMNAVVETQKNFFEHGPEHLKPLTMEEVADRIGMNVATVSRVANDKYVQTPFGVFEIRRFFNQGVPQVGGEDISKQTVKERITQLIREENPAQPLSDQEIFEKLKAERLTLARRTVTKYREELNIQAARFRKRSVKANGDTPLPVAPGPTPNSFGQSS